MPIKLNMPNRDISWKRNMLSLERLGHLGFCWHQRQSYCHIKKQSKWLIDDGIANKHFEFGFVEREP